MPPLSTLTFVLANAPKAKGWLKVNAELITTLPASTEAPCPICVVETVPDLLAIERTREFRGRYHVLHGALSPLAGVGPDQLKLKELIARLK